MLRSIRHRLEYFVFQTLVCIVDALSTRAIVRLAESLAWFIHFVLPRRWTRYHVARDNVRVAFGEQYSEAEIEQLIYRMWVHLFRTVAEIIQSARKLHIHSYRRVIHFANVNRTREALCSGRRLIMLGGHLGNWEISTSLLGIWGFPMGVVARELDNPHLHDWFRRFRELTGHRLMLKSGDYADMNALLSRGGSLGMLCDQDAGPRGLFVDFFGRPASTFKSIALLALEYDALIVVGYTIRQADKVHDCPWVKFEVGCEALIDPRAVVSNDPVGEITREYTAALERAIRKAPEQYFWLHRRWKSAPKVRQKPEQRRLAG